MQVLPTLISRSKAEMEVEEESGPTMLYTLPDHLQLRISRTMETFRSVRHSSLKRSYRSMSDLEMCGCVLCCEQAECGGSEEEAEEAAEVGAGVHRRRHGASPPAAATGRAGRGKQRPSIQAVSAAASLWR